MTSRASTAPLREGTPSPLPPARIVPLRPRAALYTRISRDDEQDHLGVRRQRDDGERELERRGVQVVAYLEDDDLSASGLKHRPDYERLIELIRNRDIDLVWAQDADRLQRSLGEFASFYAACQEAGIKVVWQGGEADFRSGEGLFELELRASFAREELRKIKRRTARKMKELAMDGKDSGGSRIYGYVWHENPAERGPDDRKVVVPAEAEVIREAAKRVLEGDTLRAVCVDLNRRGVPAPKGGEWRYVSLRQILNAPRISGRRTYQGQIVGMGDWPAIIDVDTSDRLRALFKDPTRRRGPEAGTKRQSRLLSGIARCGTCGRSMVSRPRGAGSKKTGNYICAVALIAGPRDHSLNIAADPLDDLVSKAVVEHADAGALASMLKRKADVSLVQRLEAVEARLLELADSFAAGEMTREQVARATAKLTAEQEQLSQRLERERRPHGLDGLGTAPLSKVWDSLPITRQRAIVQAFVSSVDIDPGRKGVNRFDPTRVHPNWRA